MAGRKPKLKLVKGGKEFTLIRGGKRTTKADIRKARMASAKKFLLRNKGKHSPRYDAFCTALLKKIDNGIISDIALKAIMLDKKRLEGK